LKRKDDPFYINHPKYICAMVALAAGIAVLVLLLMQKMSVESAAVIMSVGLIAAALGLFFAK